MRTPPSFAKILSTALTSLVLLGPATAAFAESAPAGGGSRSQPAPSGSAPQAGPSAATTPGQEPGQETSAAAALGEVFTPAELPKPAPDPASVTEVGIQRLPGTAYPEPVTRGLPYGSLSLTFHGMQWPYMPAVGTGSRFILGLSGWGWIDTSYEKFAPWSTSKNAPTTTIATSNVKYWQQQARLLLRLTPTYSLDNGWFIQGQAELVGTEDQTALRKDLGGADTDDLYLRVGQWNSWDLTVGRFEGWEVFHLGMGFDQNTFERQGAVGNGESAYPIGFYGVTDNQFRPAGAAGNFAAHYYPFRFLRFEVLATVGTIGLSPTLATRPVAVLDLGWLKLKLGTEYQKKSGQSPTDYTDKTSKGVGGAVQFVFLPHIEFGLNAAQGTVWSIDSKNRNDYAGSFTRTSYGGFANVSNGSAKHPLMFGVGAMYSTRLAQNNVTGNGVTDNYWLMQSFVAVQYVLKQQLYIKLVGGYSRGHWLLAGDPQVEWDDEMYSIRLRFAMYF